MDPPGTGAAVAAAAAAAAACFCATAAPFGPRDADTDERIRQALLGMQAGDALAAPLHWYYNIDAMKQHLREAWGCEQLRRYAAVPAGLQHPDSWNYMKSFDASKCKIDLMHGKPAWREGLYYHADLKPGEATHTVALANLLTRSIAEDGQYDYAKFLQRYVDFWRVPGQNTDTYIEIVHRHFFERLAEGTPLHECGMEESCLSGFTVVMPLILALHDAPDELAAAAVEGHLRLTHNSDSLVAEAMDIMGVVRSLLHGAPVRETLAAAFDRFFEPRSGEKRESAAQLAALDIDTLFLGTNPYALAGEPGCARFSLR
jgi:ADP-ribosyl-[dinitrogen reductase] hydrolase